mmetsp:Transcript_23060/g.30675  ORF Transcript_23060/g.30675 Transcript_23060/m.30675 type:complete len:146 (-) Transcript_23060:448-885(-)|eukprot:CAMPEP_0185587070 /NCGR_PEP_ID=MMETSP0434-20130131/47380_1 /TAXON_ID=626734 ORGANISM="Favella taraikaensis, Strain Fe Narragansett Bay" /NCGR_SAMPLE_ID=MMETSP0434 /ASSEMBLY_ACC=CAM_ASM_000379 /LENGTH=145 /DNA_ID=CAMNT_0028208673 /DNA_START=135 /DNA_END=572 /DNA_ORIENTATION=+
MGQFLAICTLFGRSTLLSRHQQLIDRDHYICQDEADDEESSMPMNKTLFMGFLFCLVLSLISSLNLQSAMLIFNRLALKTQDASYSPTIRWLVGFVRLALLAAMAWLCIATTCNGIRLKRNLCGLQGEVSPSDGQPEWSESTQAL